ncbi:guanyl-specific ribonuclease [Calidifontibacter terrae]
MSATIRKTQRRASFVGRHFMAIGVGVLLLVLLAALAGCGTATSTGSSATTVGWFSTSPGPAQGTTGHGAAPTTHGAAPATTTARDGLATIAYTDLPQQAKTTVGLIDAGGPYPYKNDDGVFSNREKLLPRKGSGYYREYTVVTPGSSDRGARRIIQGKDGTMYYTDDHYRSFRRITR